ncbi:MAG: iron-sulfur cluster assembly accessory protein [Gammaproteobacteria bacterium]|nr:iron-sulfur cluster assembly accessory protein [Gammaproteobacteria bacterium]
MLKGIELVSAQLSYRDDISTDDMTLTDEAKVQLAQLYGQVDDDEIEAIRIYVTGGGCSGMNYGMTFTDRRNQYDKVLAENDFSIYVDAIALEFLKGVEIDYVDRPTGASFVFNNVFTATGGTGTCGGCGASGGGGGGCG